MIFLQLVRTSRLKKFQMVLELLEKEEKKEGRGDTGSSTNAPERGSGGSECVFCQNSKTLKQLEIVRKCHILSACCLYSFRMLELSKVTCLLQCLYRLHVDAVKPTFCNQATLNQSINFCLLN